MFRQDTTCPALLSLILLTLPYTGLSPSSVGLSMPFYSYVYDFWALSFSLAATMEISVDFFSSGY